jgi:IstB-like ATP binding protein
LWHRAVFGDPTLADAILDRIIHRAHRIDLKGPSLLKVGDNLRDSIERGLKETRKCILILSPHFLSNTGWTKVKFDSVFTREIMEGSGVVLPIWHNVSAKEVHEYSPSLANKKALEWSIGRRCRDHRLHLQRPNRFVYSIKKEGTEVDPENETVG